MTASPRQAGAFVRAALLGAAAVAAGLLAAAGRPAEAAPSWLAACTAEGAPMIELSRPDAAQVLLDPYGEARVERAPDQVGDQPVEAIAGGTGLIIELDGRHLDVPWLCLLGGEDRVLFFHWMPVPAGPLEQCGGAERGQEDRKDGRTACLRRLLDAAERDLAAAQDRIGPQGGGLAESDAAWRAYRDAECARRGAAPGDGSEDAVLACLIREARERVRELNEP